MEISTCLLLLLLSLDDANKSFISRTKKYLLNSKVVHVLDTAKEKDFHFFFCSDSHLI